jgi:hypothetical protein
MEQVLWEGRRSFWYYVPKIAWSLIWMVFWIWIGSSLGPLLARLENSSFAGLPEAVRNLKPLVSNYGHYLCVLALFALWGAARSVLSYLNAYFIITTQRVKVRTGSLSRTLSQIELFRLKDLALRTSLWGRITGYSHILLISSDRLMSETMLYALPNGEPQLEMIRTAAQRARSESGIVNIAE